MKLPRIVVAAGCAGLLALPPLLAGKLGTLLLNSSADLGATLAEAVPLSWQARAAAAAADDAGDTPAAEELDPPASDRTSTVGSSDGLAASTEGRAAAPQPRAGAVSRQRGETDLGRERGQLAPRRTVPRGIRVRQSRVLALSRTAAIPGASPVAASVTRPAGLRLSGVGGLGVGVQDGDVLTHAAGQPLRSLAQVIGLVAGARHARASEVSGTLYRGEESINLIVEMPYLDGGDERAASPRGAIASQSARGR